MSVAYERCVDVCANSWFPLFQHESNTSDGVDQLFERLDIHLSTKSCDMHINDIVEWRSTRGLLPDIARQHIAHHNLTFVAHQVLEKFKFAPRQIDMATAACDLSSHDVHVEIGNSEAQHIHGAASAKQRADARQQLFESERLDQIVVCAAV